MSTTVTKDKNGNLIYWKVDQNGKKRRIPRPKGGANSTKTKSQSKKSICQPRRPPYVKELREMAKARGIPGYSTMRKAELCVVLDILDEGDVVIVPQKSKKPLKKGDYIKARIEGQGAEGFVYAKMISNDTARIIDRFTKKVIGEPFEVKRNQTQVKQRKKLIWSLIPYEEIPDLSFKKGDYMIGKPSGMKPICVRVVGMNPLGVDIHKGNPGGIHLREKGDKRLFIVYDNKKFIWRAKTTFIFKKVTKKAYDQCK